MMHSVATVNTGYISDFRDISNKTREVRHSVIFNAGQKEDLEEQIVEELYRIFTHKAD